MAFQVSPPRELLGDVLVGLLNADIHHVHEASIARCCGPGIHLADVRVALSGRPGGSAYHDDLRLLVVRQMGHDVSRR
jgi:hypothetical protein